MIDVIKIQNFLKDTLNEILNENGAVYYSSINTLKPGRILILGLNPGGDPEKIKYTINDSIDNFIDPNYNEYYQEWEEGKEHRLQKNLKAIANSIGIDLKDICASNLIFKRSRTEKDADYSILDLCIKIHQKTIEIVEPKVILTFGRTPYEKLKDQFRSLNFDIKENEPKKSGHGIWVIRHFDLIKNNKTVKVIGLPHLSVYTIYNREEQLSWVKECVDNS